MNSMTQQRREGEANGPQGQGPARVSRGGPIFQLDLVRGDVMTGTVSASNWTASVVGYRGGLYQGGHSAKYTLIIPGSANSLAQPGGDGCGTVTVSASGAVTFGGTLADGTVVSQGATLSKLGLWPLYISLYQGKGLITGWLTISNQAASDITGAVNWIKLPQSSSTYYPSGFALQSEVLGSLYSFTNGVRVLNLTTGRVWLAEGNLPSEFSNQFALSAKNQVTSTNKNLTLTINTTSGLFQGSVKNPYAAKAQTLSFKGALLQKQNLGGGYFLGTNQIGYVELSPEP